MRPRILFLGQKPVGEAAWRYLRQEEQRTGAFEVVGVCSNRSSDAVWWGTNQIHQERGDVPFVDNAERNNDLLLKCIQEQSVDTLLCVQHPWILPRALLEAVSFRAINFHNAKLPEYKGYNAVNHAILNGDETFTCTAHWMSEEVDVGEICYEAVFAIEPIDTALSLYAKGYHACLELCRAVVCELGDLDRLPRRPATGQHAFYPRRSIESLRAIAPGDDVDRKARAFFFPPFEPAFWPTRGRKVHALPVDPRVDELVQRDAVAVLNRAIARATGNFSCDVSPRRHA